MAGAGFTALAVAHTFGTAAALAVTIVLGTDLPRRATWRAIRRSVWSALGIGAVLALAAPVMVRGLASLVAVAMVGGAAALTINLWDTRSVVIAAVRARRIPRRR
jgi:hypothetical protein